MRDYGQDLSTIRSFLVEYVAEDEKGIPIAKYVEEIKRLAVRQQVAITIDVADVEVVNPELAAAIMANTRRYVKLFSDAVQNLIPKYKVSSPVRNVFVEFGYFLI